MNPKSTDIFGRLSWLTKSFKNLCCRLGILEQTVAECCEGGGGGGTNPTSEYIPYNDAGTFADSYLKNVNQPIDKYLRATYGTAVGLDIDFSAEAYVLGDINNPLPNLQGGFIVNSGQVSTKSAGSLFGFSSGATDMVLGDYLAQANDTVLRIDDAASTIKTAYGGNDVGLNLDFANNIYSFGKTNFGYYQTGNTACYFGDHSGSFNNNVLILDDLNGTLQTYYSGAGFGLSFEYTNLLFTIGDYGYSNAGTSIVIDDTNSLIKTQYGGNDVGLKLDFVNGDVYLGDPFGIIGPSSTSVYMYVTPGSEQISLNAGGNTYFYCEKAIDSCYVGTYSSNFYFTEGSSVRLFDNTSYNGFEIIYNASLSDITDVKIGDYTNTTTGTSIITDVTNSFIKSQYGGNDSGIILDFANEQYGIGDIGGLGGSTQFFIDDANGVIKGRSAGSDNGLLLDFNSGLYYIGNYGGPGTHIKIDDTGTIKSFFGSTAKGFNLDNITNIYDFGDVGGGAWLSIDGTNTSVTTSTQVLVFDDGGSGALLSNTSSGNSGQHLVVTIDGTIYHIKLEIP